MPSYINGNYSVIILQDGTKIRKCLYDEFKPSFAENCDVKITDRCSQGCKFCYEGCSKDGQHANIDIYKNLLDSLHPYTELAINGNDLDHPYLDDFLKHLKSKKVFTNITVNQNQFLKNIDRLKMLQENKLIYGIGVSLTKVDDELINKLQSIPNTVLHTIIGIVSPTDINILKNKNIKILFLGYKKLKRGISYHQENKQQIKEYTQFIQDNFNDIVNSFRVISFDNLAIEQLNVKKLISKEEWEHFYMGDDGDFTFYIDLVKGEFARNSICNKKYPIGNKTIDEMFNFLKNEKKYEE